MNDVLGHPIIAGATILTNYYGCATMGAIAKVKKVNKKSITVNVETRVYDYTTRQSAVAYKDVKRQPHQMVVIDQQLGYNKNTYPEAFI